MRSYPRVMKRHLLLLGCALALLIVPGQAAEEAKAKVLHDQMELMDDAFKAFRKETDPVKGATQAREAQLAAIKCAGEVPEMVQAMPDGPAKAKAQVEYRKMIGKLIVTFCEVEEAFVNGKIEDVTKIVDALKEMKKAGHDQFMEDE